MSREWFDFAVAVARCIAIVVATAVALWCIWRAFQTALEPGWREWFGWILGFMAARLATHALTLGLRGQP